jgi:hypothetical protein
MTSQTVTRETLLETAIASLVESMRRERAGEDVGSHYRDQVEPAVDAALAAGWTGRDIHGGADRCYGQWLIDQAGQAAA